MTLDSKIEIVQTLVGNDQEATSEVCGVYLTLAADKILSRLYPFGKPCEDFLPDEYGYMQCELASRYFLRRGGEGEISHSENGVSRTYASVDDEDILRRIVPFAGVIG